MERTHTEKNSANPNNAHNESQHTPPTNTKPLSKSKSQKNSVKSHAQLTQEVKKITNQHREKLSDSSCSISEKRG